MKEYEEEQIKIWNNQACQNDLIYHLGDFCNYSKLYKNYPSGLLCVSKVEAKVILIIGNYLMNMKEKWWDGDIDVNI